MRKHLFIFIFEILFSILLFAGNNDTLRMMTYNLRFEELASMEDVENYIKSQNPDIVALQECDWTTHRETVPYQNGVKFVNELASHTGLFAL